MPRCEIVTTVERLLSVDVVAEEGLVVRFLATDGLEHHLQLHPGEAHGLADMVAIAITTLPAPRGQAAN